MTTTITKVVWNFNQLWTVLFNFLVIPTTFFSIILLDAVHGTQRFVFCLLAYFAGSFLFALLGRGIAISHFGLFSNMRISYNFWKESEYMVCTGISIMMLPFFVFLFAFLLSNKKTFLFLLIVPLIIIALLVNASVQNRGFFVSALISFLIILVVYFKQYKKSKKGMALVLVLFGSSLALYLFVFVLVHINAFDLQTKLVKIPLLYRFFGGGSDSARMKIYSEFFSNFYRFPLGGLLSSGVLSNAKYIHNLWLDIYADVGLIPFLLFLFLSLRTVYEIVLRDRLNLGKKRHLFLCSMLLGFFSISFLEPTFAENMYAFGACLSIMCASFVWGNKNAVFFWRGANGQPRIPYFVLEI